ncbi:Legume-like lectin family protein [Histomonas meleagridis]|uniref:Legume-like lectin family protein n=1 Tax=Histomonas meleagridis TaxID=135588 RepID=UPI00355A239A|nr:Legume-like lectin family protein [Histomonas meleagridis]KAH0801993.1 Legume-like lectin family protein [Histomonas meleagridis]
MFTIFFFLSSSGNSENLSPPFEPTEQGDVGYWEVGGSTVIYPDKIMLIPPIQYRQGFLWAKFMSPRGPWSVSFQIDFGYGNDGGGFNFLINNKFGDYGPIFGGPSKFVGISFIGSLTTNQKTDFLNLRLIQSTGEKSYTVDNLPDPMVSIAIQKNNPLLIKLEIKNGNISAYIDSVQYISQPLQITPFDHFIGLTASSDTYFTEIYLHQISIEAQKLSMHNHTLGDHKNQRSIDHDRITSYRNPIFNNTVSELQKLHSINPKGLSDVTETTDASVDKVLNVIDEINEVTFDIPSFSELTGFVQDNLMTTVRRWQRRTLKIVERAQDARNVAGSAIESTEEVLDFFNYTLRSKVFKTNEQIMEFQELLVQLALDGIDEGDVMSKMADRVNKSSAIRIVVLGSIIELLLLAGFFAALNIPAIRRKLLSW